MLGQGLLFLFLFFLRLLCCLLGALILKGDRCILYLRRRNIYWGRGRLAWGKLSLFCHNGSRLFFSCFLLATAFLLCPLLRSSFGYGSDRCGVLLVDSSWLCHRCSGGTCLARRFSCYFRLLHSLPAHSQHIPYAGLFLLCFGYGFVLRQGYGVDFQHRRHCNHRRRFLQFGQRLACLNGADCLVLLVVVLLQLLLHLFHLLLLVAYCSNHGLALHALRIHFLRGLGAARAHTLFCSRILLGLHLAGTVVRLCIQDGITNLAQRLRPTGVQSHLLCYRTHFIERHSL